MHRKVFGATFSNSFREAEILERNDYYVTMEVLTTCKI